MKKCLSIMLGLAIVAMAFTTEARRDDTPTAQTEPLFLMLKPGLVASPFATVNQLSVLTQEERSRCICQGYCEWLTAPPHYGQWVLVCVEGTTPFYIYGIGTQFFCYYCPPAPC